MQKKEINDAIELLKTIGIDINNWTFCYPYGNYNNVTLEILRSTNCKAAFTTKVDIANIKRDNRFTLPRLDTNDIPKNRNAKTNKWYSLG